jgi:hypothetical protein
MLELVAIVLAMVALAAIITLAARVRVLEERQRQLESRPLQVLPEVAPEKPLAGMCLSIQIDQDHPHAPFVTQLKDLLEREDVTLVEEGDSNIRGSVSCNRYADVYFSAEISCTVEGETVCTIIERPPHGDRQANLAKEVVHRLKREVVKQRTHDERRNALRELG